MTRLGLRENLAQFSLLVAVNAFVGAMVGLERSTLPLIGREDFGLTSSAAVLAFIVAFGLSKALTNLGAGALAERLGRRRLLIAGWALALPVPLNTAIVILILGDLAFTGTLLWLLHDRRQPRENAT